MIKKCSDCEDNEGNVPADNVSDSIYQVTGAAPNQSLVTELLQKITGIIKTVSIGEYNAFNDVKTVFAQYLTTDTQTLKLDTLINDWNTKFDSFTALVVDEILQSNDQLLFQLVKPNIDAIKTVIEALAEEDGDDESETNVTNYVSALVDGTIEIPYTLNVRSCLAWGFLALAQLNGETTSYQINGLDYTTSNTVSMDNSLIIATLSNNELTKTIRSCMYVEGDMSKIKLASSLKLLKIIPDLLLDTSAIKLSYECQLTDSDFYKISLKDFTVDEEGGQVTLFFESTEEVLEASDLSVGLVGEADIKVQLENSSGGTYDDLEINKLFGTTTDILAKVTVVPYTQGVFQSAKSLKITSKAGDSTSELKDRKIKLVVTQSILINSIVETAIWEVTLDFQTTTPTLNVITSTLSITTDTGASLVKELAIYTHSKYLTKKLIENGTESPTTTVYFDNGDRPVSANEIEIKKVTEE